MNGWCPRLSPDGAHLMSGMGTWVLDGRDMGPGYLPTPLDINHLLVYREGTEQGLWAYTPAWDAYALLVPGVSLNGLAAGAGRWAYHNQDGITFDDGATCDGYEPAVWGSHFAYVTQDEAGQHLRVDGAEVWAGPILTTTTPPRVRAGAHGLTWISQGLVWGLAWGGAPLPRAPDWRPSFFAVPVSGPHDESWLLVSSEHPATGSARIALVPWGTHEGIVVVDRPDLLHPDAVWTGSEWRVVACDGQGVLYEWRVFADAPRTDLSVDDRPPMPQPEIAFVLHGTQGRVTTHAHCRTHRWQADEVTCPPSADQPNDGLTYWFDDLPVGLHQIRLIAQGELADEAHLPDSGGQVIVTPSQPLEIWPPTPPGPPPFLGLKRGCQTGFGAPLVTPTENVYRELARRGWHLCRVTAAHDAETTAAIIAEVEHGPHEPLVIVDEATILTIAARTYDTLKAEFYNEPDLMPVFRTNPAAYAARFVASLPQAQARGLDLHVGPISNPDPGGLAWLRQVLAALPPETPVAYHRYPQDVWDVASRPRKPYGSRTAEFAALRAVTGSRRLLCSEFGWKQDRVHQGGIKIGRWYLGGRWRALTDREIQQRMRQEFDIIEDENDRALAAGQPPIYAAVWYQLWEGDTELFGLMHQDRSWKPQADLTAP